MEIRSNGGISVSLYSAMQAGNARRNASETVGASPGDTTQVSISEAGQAAVASSEASATRPKSADELTASELDAAQKKGGFVNTMAYLSPAEKALYDEAVAKGDSKAATGLAQIALIRTGGMAAGQGGSTYDPDQTAITAENISQYFRHSIVDQDGNSDPPFDALTRFLEGRDTKV